MDHHHTINTDWITPEEVVNFVRSEGQVSLGKEVTELIEKCRTYLNEKVQRHPDPIYGINTGFGSLCNTSISEEDLEQLQANLVMSHACGAGELVPKEIVKIMLILKIQSLSYGHSGVQLKTVERLCDFYNQNVLPVIFTQGSLGASGDLAPLAHLSLPLLGMGKVYDGEKQVDASTVSEKKNWEDIQLQSKEGLALLNGTQFMSSYGAYMVVEAQKIVKLANKIMALSLEAYDGRPEPFKNGPHVIRKQPGQLRVAQDVRQYWEGSELISRAKEHVQDPYSFRCVPQVHGACSDSINYVYQVVENEINSATDNPNVFPDEDDIISAGNFHGQPLAMAFDQLSIALAEIGSISERRTYKLISGTRGLPAFLVSNPGLNSGFMIPQYTQASIVSQNKQLCTPASVDTIDSSNGQEDHVSMGANAATKAYKVLQNTKMILAIELMNASQAIEFRRPAKTSETLEKWLTEYRSFVPFMEKDEVIHDMMQKSLQFIDKQLA